MAYFRADQAPSASDRGKTGVLIVNLGTPARASYFSVWRYLAEFLGDRRVIDTPRILWWPVLYGFILPLRSFRTARIYRKIWSDRGSPLAFYSRALSDKMAARLEQSYEDQVCVELAMTYGAPTIAAAVKRLVDRGTRRLLVLPLFPQYSSTTTGAVFDRLSSALRRLRWIPELRFVNDYFADPGYVDAIARSVDRVWRERGGRSHLLISFHGIPQVYVDRGDPYRLQVERTASLIAARLGLTASDWSLAYQSRFGPVLWLRPYMDEILVALAHKGVRELTVVSPSFAVDCLETLEEVGMQYRERFAELGGRLHLVPALNDEDAHAEVLIGVLNPHLRAWGLPPGP